jgi:hypothetical protein
MRDATPTRHRWLVSLAGPALDNQGADTSISKGASTKAEPGAGTHALALPGWHDRLMRWMIGPYGSCGSC